jgi:hypothetical protein
MQVDGLWFTISLKEPHFTLYIIKAKTKNGNVKSSVKQLQEVFKDTKWSESTNIKGVLWVHMTGSPESTTSCLKRKELFP